MGNELGYRKMSNSHHGVTVVNSQNQLLEDLSCSVLLQEGSLRNILQEVSSRGIIHHKAQVCWCQQNLQTMKTKDSDELSP